jgi:hypothetical protein
MTELKLDKIQLTTEESESGIQEQESESLSNANALLPTSFPSPPPDQSLILVAPISGKCGRIASLLAPPDRLQAGASAGQGVGYNLLSY